jgi:hypothetical protein
VKREALGSRNRPARRGATHRRGGTCHDATGVERHDQDDPSKKSGP